MPAVRPGTALALLPLVMAMLLPLAAGNILPGPVVVNVGGVDYKVTTVHCNQLVHCNNIMPTSAAWGDESLSQQLAVAVDASLGSGPLYTTPTNYGPLFVWTYAFNNVYRAWYYSFCSMMFGATAQDTCNTIDQYFTAYIAMAMALPSSPGALDCGAATFAPSLLESRLDGQICAAYKAVRRGQRAQFLTNVTLSLPGASVVITYIVTNQPTADAHCGCCRTKQDNCRCLPSAVLLGGGNFMVMPQLAQKARQVVDTKLQVYFTATAGNGSTCNGAATICSSRGVGSPPACTPFNSTGVTQSAALVCS